MYGETIAPCSEVHRSRCNKICGQDADILNAETGTAITQSNQVHFKSYCLEIIICTAKFNTKILYFFHHTYIYVIRKILAINSSFFNKID